MHFITSFITEFVYFSRANQSLFNVEKKTTFNHILLGNLRFEFKGFNPPAENIAKMIWNILREKLSSNFGLEIILVETDKNKAISNGK